MRTITIFARFVLLAAGLVVIASLDAAAQVKTRVP